MCLYASDLAQDECRDSARTSRHEDRIDRQCYGVDDHAEAQTKATDVRRRTRTAIAVGGKNGGILESLPGAGWPKHGSSSRFLASFHDQHVKLPV